MKPIWIVDDDQSIRFVLEKALLRENLRTRSFTNPRDVLIALGELDASKGLHDEHAPQILVSDIRMPGGSGLDLLEKIKQKLPNLPVIIMTAYSDLDSAVSAFQGGAFEYLPKPFDVPKAIELIRRAVDESLREEVAEDRMTAAPEMLGQAPAMQDVFRAIGKLSQSNVTVMITGESGTGKELVARALHKHSPRGDASKMAVAKNNANASAAASLGGTLIPGLNREGPFVAINTAAIPKDLLESELFGHERGAFTGAQTMRRGRFEQADGGTLFLDEIGDMPFELQTRLLRVLSDGHFYRVGGHNAIKTNVRVIAATHQDLEQRVKEGGFREDLFHRLNVIRLRLPALRQRREDIPMLTKHFLQQSAKQLDVDPKRITDAALSQLAEFSFPGNVRQLENICHWLTVMAPSQVIEAKDLPPEILELTEQAATSERVATSSALNVQNSTTESNNSAPINVANNAYIKTVEDDLPAIKNAASASAFSSAALPPTSAPASESWEQLVSNEVQTLLTAGAADVWDVMSRRFESRLIVAALASTKGRRIDAAQKLGMGRNTITRKIQELGLDKE